MSRLPIIIAGHSHATALGVLLRSPENPNRLVPLASEAPEFVGFTGAWPRDAAFWEGLVRQAAKRDVVLVWMGAQHLTQFLFAAVPPFDFVLAEAPELPIDPQA